MIDYTNIIKIITFLSLFSKIINKKSIPIRIGLVGIYTVQLCVVNITVYVFYTFFE